MHMTQRSYQLRNMVAKPEGYNVNHCGANGSRRSADKAIKRHCRRVGLTLGQPTHVVRRNSTRQLRWRGVPDGSVFSAGGGCSWKVWWWSGACRHTAQTRLVARAL